MEAREEVPEFGVCRQVNVSHEGFIVDIPYSLWGQMGNSGGLRVVRYLVSETSST